MPPPLPAFVFGIKSKLLSLYLRPFFIWFLQACSLPCPQPQEAYCSPCSLTSRHVSLLVPTPHLLSSPSTWRTACYRHLGSGWGTPPPGDFPASAQVGCPPPLGSVCTLHFLLSGPCLPQDLLSGGRRQAMAPSGKEAVSDCSTRCLGQMVKNSVGQMSPGEIRAERLWILGEQKSLSQSHQLSAVSGYLVQEDGQTPE